MLCKEGWRVKVEGVVVGVLWMAESGMRLLGDGVWDTASWINSVELPKIQDQKALDHWNLASMEIESTS